MRFDASDTYADQYGGDPSEIPAFPDTGSFTVEFACTKTLGDANGRAVIGNIGNTGTTGSGFELHWSASASPTLNVSVADGTNFLTNNTLTPALASGTRYHLAVTVDRVNNLVTAWVDGVVQSAQQRSISTITGSLNTSGNTVYAGAYYNGTVPMNGDIEHWRIWDGVLTAEQIAEAARGGTPTGTALRRNWIPGPPPARYWRLDLATTDAPQLGRLVLAPHWEPSGRIKYGWALGAADASRRMRTWGGQDWVDRQPRRRQIALELSYLDEDEAYTHLWAAAWRNGQSLELLAIPDETSAYAETQLVYGLAAAAAPVKHEAHRIFTQQLSLEDRL
jgi:hypothetical protein